MNRPRCLITGISGLLGNNLADYFKNRWEILGLYHRNPVCIDGVYTQGCDITDSKSIYRIVADFDPDLLIHCASLTDIDECEVDREYTHLVNVEATSYIVESIRDRDAKLVYISTDAVYDGAGGGFLETDEVRPRNYYGLSKHEGELEAQKKESALIFRTNIFGWNIIDKKSLGEWVVHALKAGETIKGFIDAVFSSIYTVELARIIDISLKRNLSGTFNCGSVTPASKYEFCNKIAHIFGLDETLIVPSSIEDFGFCAKRGKNLSLDVEKLQEALNYQLPTLDYCIESFYRDYQTGKPEIIKSGRSLNNPSNFISYGRQWVDANDIRSVVDVVKSGPITQGPKVKAFEEALQNYCSANFAVALNSGTSGLHIACLAAVLKEGDEGITSPITFVASANCMIYCGGKPVFADINPKTYNISPEEVEKKITSKTKVVIPVHFAGQSCDMESIFRIVKDAENRFGNKIYIIEDASHALGSEYNGSNVGSCAYSDMAVMSFHPVKHITTGEGGAVFTNDESLFKRLRRLRSHGITSTFEEFVFPRNALALSDSEDQKLINPWYYEQIDLGLNYRITDIHCALGISQLKRLGQFKRRRREIVGRAHRGRLLRRDREAGRGR
ncbi:MAG: NAD-dependent epimerase/dehydratase family protein, partial [Desulfobacteraceae bacterium]